MLFSLGMIVRIHSCTGEAHPTLCFVIYCHFSKEYHIDNQGVHSKFVQKFRHAVVDIKALVVEMWQKTFDSLVKNSKSIPE